MSPSSSPPGLLTRTTSCTALDFAIATSLSLRLSPIGTRYRPSERDGQIPPWEMIFPRRRSSAAVHGALFFFATVLVAVVAAVFFLFSLVAVATLFLFFLELTTAAAFEDVIVVAVGLPGAAAAVVAAAAVALTSAATSAPGSKRTGSLREREVDRLLTLVMVLDNMVEED